MSKTFIEFIKKNWLGLILSILFTELVGFISSIFAGNVSDIYYSLNQQMFSPPNWLFPLVWTVLYAFMAVSVYLILISNATKNQKIISIILYMFQLGLNFSWPIIFFKFQLFDIGVLIIIILTMLVSIMMMYFYEINKISGLLILPYLAWLLIAFYLAVGIFILN